MIRHFAAVLLSLSATAFAQTKPATVPADITTPPANAETLESGLVTLKLSDGDGKTKPPADAFVKMSYVIRNQDGKVIDQTRDGLAAIQPLPRMLSGWRQTVSMMTVGETRRAWIPEALCDGKVAPGTSLVIDSTLVEIIDGPKTPVDVAAPPADAIVSKSGLASKILKEGSGEPLGTAKKTVRVHYSGWTTDGRMFDSSVLRGKPAEFPLTGVIRGWTEGVPLMKVGETRRFWVPANLAYGDDPSKPQGMLVFDIELLAVK